MKKVTPRTLQQMKERGEKITFIAVYDYPLAKILDECGVDAFLVGDSLTVHLGGKKDDLSTTIEDMIYHTQIVMRAANRALVVTDMPFMSYEVSIEEAKRNAGRIMKEGGADAVKLEGGIEIAETVRALVRAGIPVMGHIGFKSQSIKLTGEVQVRGLTEEDKTALMEDAKAIEDAGAFMLGLVIMNTDIAREITAILKIPTIGIGAGRYCDGQSLLIYDLIGLAGTSKTPKFIKNYANVRDIATTAVKKFIKEVKEVGFPDEEHSF